ncbi:hypothetical protein L6164_021919 [Bauhinia variegata]|uniref:Uncharacterized protein n=1 Tax=Bauhinia variegata TaxID=167791 RepID=A0ACB9MF17_BAUVA|nr:hypothetical protein L6164_021919 [Bauhinia variegata]
MMENQLDKSQNHSTDLCAEVVDARQHTLPKRKKFLPGHLVGSSSYSAINLFLPSCNRTTPPHLREIRFSALLFLLSSKFISGQRLSVLQIFLLILRSRINRMAMTSPTPQRKRISVPPRRGQIKVQIFHSFVESVVSAVSMAEEFLGKLTGNGGDGCDSAYPTAKFLQVTTPRGTPVILNPVKWVIFINMPT